MQDMLAPNVLCEYIYQVALRIHAFYTTCHIIDNGQINWSRYQLTLKIRNIMKQCLEILELPVIERM